MKITIEIPDTTVCGFFNYVFADEGGLAIGSKSLGTDEINKAREEKAGDAE